MWRLLKRWVVDGCAARPCGCNSRQRRGRPEVITLKTTRLSSRSLDESWHSPKKNYTLHAERKIEKMNSNREEYISNVSTQPLFPPFGRQVECLLLQLAGRPINRPTFLNAAAGRGGRLAAKQFQICTGPSFLSRSSASSFPFATGRHWNRPPTLQDGNIPLFSYPRLVSFIFCLPCVDDFLVAVRRGVYPQIRPPGGQVSRTSTHLLPILSKVMMLHSSDVFMMDE